MRALLVAATLSTLAAASADAQMRQWTAAQQEVWRAEQACWEAKTAAELMPCFHDDFIGWGLGSTVTTTKALRRPGFERNFQREEMVMLQLVPVDIVVRGNMAVVMYVARYTNRNRATGEETTHTERWTDVMINDGGRWSWISDHGVLLES